VVGVGLDVEEIGISTGFLEAWADGVSGIVLGREK
jgi:hypothetical protein